MINKISLTAIIILFFFIISPCYGQRCNWELSHPYVYGYDFTGVWGYSSTDYFIATSQGVNHYDGAKFSCINTGANSPKRLWGWGRTHLFGVNEMPDLFHGEGGIWSSERYPRCDYNFYDIWGANPSDVYVAGSCDWGPGTDGQILRYNGTTWEAAISGGYDFLDVYGFSSTDVYATGIFMYYDMYDAWLGPWGYLFH